MFNHINNITDMKTRQLLSETQMCDLVCRYQRSNDLNELMPVVETLYGLINSMAHHHLEQGAVEWDDMIEEGILGLFDAAKDFQPQLSECFTSFARNYISNAIRSFCTENSFPISRPRRSTTQLTFESIDNYNYESDNDEEADISTLLPQSLIVSLDNDTKPKIAALQQAFGSLSEPERKAIEMSYNNESLTDTVIAQQIGITPTRLRQLRRYSLRKMRIYLQ